eukprot:6485689-Amphidinium_carterae.1
MLQSAEVVSERTVSSTSLRLWTLPRSRMFAAELSRFAFAQQHATCEEILQTPVFRLLPSWALAPYRPLRCRANASCQVSRGCLVRGAAVTLP